MSNCWFMESKEPYCFIQLGRYGDIILLLPAFREIASQTGTNPVLIVAHEFASLLQGVSYVRPIELNIGWLEVKKAKAVAAANGFENVVIPKWWDDPDGIKPEYRGTFALNYKGKTHTIDVRKFPNYMSSQWECCGFAPEDIFALPLVFDKRSHVREAHLIKLYCQRQELPIIAYNFNGITSPFGYMPEILNVIRPRFHKRCRFLDLGAIRAQRIFDLLGIMDSAAGVISIDTATGHLATASKTPHALFVADGWGGSVPRGNCQFHCRYSEAVSKLPELIAWIESRL